MGIFRTKNKTEKEVESSEKMKKKYGYRITICDPMGESARELKTFGAHKRRGDDGIVWLINEDEDFEELFPLDSKYESNGNLQEIEKEISNLKNLKPNPTENPYNKQEAILKLEKLKKMMLHPKGSFLKIDKDGMPHIIYIRYRTSFIPLKWDLDFGVLHTPYEALVKNVLIKEREKKDKYAQKNQGIFTTGMIIWGAILLIWTACIAYYSIHWYDKIDQSRVNELNQRIDQAGLVCNERAGFAMDNFVRASEYSVNITSGIYERINPAVNNNVDVENAR